SVTFDFDNDGDLDILVVNQKPVKAGYPVESMTHLYRNDSVGGNWLQIKLVGKRSDANGLGATVLVYANNTTMMREVDGGGSSHLSQNSMVLHFGLDNQSTIDSIVVKWIGASSQKVLNVKSNQILEVVQDEEILHDPINPFWIMTFLLVIILAVVFIIKAKRRVKL
ncbi:MAG TPA: ASPIC/UnbV domain-containing protein, partial [Saprospiraceae bacterium]|nr:ASPIC/UnbV domain-containing protein [Saprospiraceae bacterium]